jgi:hypothetical protein
MNLYENRANFQSNFHGDESLPGNWNNATKNIKDYFPFAQNVPSSVMDKGLEKGRDMLKEKTGQWTSNASGFWTSLKPYFAVRFLFIIS